MDDVTTFLFGKRFPNRLFVGGLPVNTTAIELADFFKKITRNVTEAKVIMDEEGISKGYGFVTFQTKQDIATVMSMGTIFFKNKRLNLGPAVKKEGPTVQPEVVIVPNARSHGQYYYPEPVPLQPTVSYQQPSQQMYHYYPAYQPQTPLGVYYNGWDFGTIQPQTYIDPNVQFYQNGEWFGVEAVQTSPVYCLEQRRGSTSSSEMDPPRPANRKKSKRGLPPRLRTRKETMPAMTGRHAVSGVAVP